MHFVVSPGRRAQDLPNSGLDIFKTEVFLKTSSTPNLLDQVAGWLQFLSPGVRITSDLLAGTDDARLAYEYVGRRGFLESNSKIRPTNVGFGLTYSLPIVVACLSAQPGSLLLIENPEAHLHPLGQFAMGDLLARASREGVQIVVETHSDHVLNGIRLAVKRGVIESSEVVVHYFTRDVETGYASIESPAILEDGRLSSWPKGFFDQWDTALDALVKE
jgi:predicted ATPase